LTGRAGLCSAANDPILPRRTEFGFAAAADPGRTSSLELLTCPVGDDLVRVNQRIIEYMHSPVALIPQLAGTRGRRRQRLR
jgi:hypothetical protein